jgi:hypothetical protein
MAEADLGDIKRKQCTTFIERYCIEISVIEVFEDLLNIIYCRFKK